MQADRCTILYLIAAGRITSAQAERLLVLSNERTETIWTLAACFAAALLMQSQSHPLWPDVLHTFKALLAEFPAAIHQIQLVVTQGMGGAL